MAQLDALRCFAVTAVVIAHLWHPVGRLELASLGVRLFFVLSGFLITGILLDCRHASPRLSTSGLLLVRQFYVRRFLRIFPIYYLVIAVALARNLAPIRDIWPWLVTYTTNVRITLFDTWGGPFGPFWSLAVEEQFYLLWPWVVLFAPRKWLMPVLLVGIAAAPLYRWYAFYRFPFDIMGMDFKAATLTPGNLDTLGAGALVALLWRSDISREVVHRRLTQSFLPLGISLHLLLLTGYYFRITPVAFFAFADVASAMVFAWLVTGAALGFGGVAGRVLESRPFVYIGKISYGIYVYHSFAPSVLASIFERLGIPFIGPGLSSSALASGLTLIVSVLSWRFLESPINGLKRHFEYSPTRTRKTPESILARVRVS
jgi:peptidoglycan/LPS O-acetylase OafA/YrhL